MKPLLVGLHNPLSADPQDALAPWPPKHTGGRTLELIQEIDPEFTVANYLAAFDRTNLWRGKDLPTGRGEIAAFAAEGARIRKLVSEHEWTALFGVRVAAAVLDTTNIEFFQSHAVRYGMNVGCCTVLPHPSGRNTLYNQPEFRRRAGRILLDAARGVEPCVP